MGKPKLNLLGKIFGRLTVIECVGTKKGYTMWLCKCDCGNEKIIRGNSLTQNLVSSCGCINSERILKINEDRIGTSIYKDINKRLLNIYNSMKSRCYVKSNINYKNYGARGITICDEWLNNSMNFYNWAIENGYSNELTIDRKDVNGNYEPNNCKWATMKEQSNNKRTNVYVTIKGETHTIAEWADIVGISHSGFKYRLDKNYSDDMLLSKPIKNNQLANEAMDEIL